MRVAKIVVNALDLWKMKCSRFNDKLKY